MASRISPELFGFPFFFSFLFRFHSRPREGPTEARVSEDDVILTPPFWYQSVNPRPSLLRYSEAGLGEVAEELWVERTVPRDITIMQLVPDRTGERAGELRAPGSPQGEGGQFQGGARPLRTAVHPVLARPAPWVRPLGSGLSLRPPSARWVGIYTAVGGSGLVFSLLLPVLALSSAFPPGRR